MTFSQQKKSLLQSSVFSLKIYEYYSQSDNTRLILVLGASLHSKSRMTKLSIQDSFQQNQ